MRAWFPCALLIRSTSTSYDNKRDLPNFQSEYSRIITLGLKFSNGYKCGPLMAHENLINSNRTALMPSLSLHVNTFSENAI